MARRYSTDRNGIGLPGRAPAGYGARRNQPGATTTYDTGHHVLSRTDAIGNKTQYSYDAYGRLSEVQYYPSGFSGGAEDAAQRVNYYYDNTVPSYYTGATPVNGLGRLTGVSFPGGVKDSTYDAHYYTNVYSYNAAGRILEQTSSVMASASNNFNIIEPVSPAFATLRSLPVG
jgi:YD repeat-containing protein